MDQNLNSMLKTQLLGELVMMKRKIKTLEDFIYGTQISEARIRDLAVDTAKIKDAAITNAKISDLTWDKGFGGTLELGGNSNQNGILSILDGSGNEKGHWDKDGITVRDGKIIIENSDGDNAIDDLGVNSQRLSGFAATSSTGLNQLFDNTITGVETEITGSPISFTLPRDTNVLILVKVTIYAGTLNAGNNGNLTVFLKDGSTTIDRLTFGGNRVAYDANIKSLHCHWFGNMTAGSKTIKLNGFIESVTGAPTMYIYQYRLTVLTLGK